MFYLLRRFIVHPEDTKQEAMEAYKSVVDKSKSSVAEGHGEFSFMVNNVCLPHFFFSFFQFE